MLHMPKSLGNNYSPLYFLASLGAGGLTVTFFMFLMFWVPHPTRPVPVFSDMATVLSDGSLLARIMILIAMAGIAFFAFLHYRLLVWNIRELSRYRHTEAYRQLKSGNAETQFKAVPLTFAMAVNVGFILGLVFVPRLWLIVEYLFPFAILAFLTIGVITLKMLGAFFGRVMTQGGFDLKANNSFAQLLPAFALGMVAVGLAAPAAMSSTPLIVGVAEIMATFFMVAALLVALVATILGFHSMIEQGTSPEAAPTLMIVIPILTVLGIAMMRMDHGMHTHFDVHATAGETLVMLSRLLSVQVLFGLLGLVVMRKQNYAANYLADGGQRSAGSYALICPGVALSVMLHFFINKGLVATSLITKFSAMYWLLTIPAIALQIMMIWLVLRLQRQHFGSHDSERMIAPAH